MQDLKVIGVESGALLVATDAGSEFRLPVTLSLQSQLRQAAPDQVSSLARSGAPRVSPREVQASIRAGRTARQVADETGAEIDYVRRFEGPVLDERAFVLESARAVPVSVAGGIESRGEAARFGEVIDSRLDESSASGREWTAFKDPAVGWIVRVTYTTSDVDRDAAWRFEPKKQSLAPHAGDALTLSRQDADHSSLVPRLRAVANDDAHRIGDELDSTLDDTLRPGLSDAERSDAYRGDIYRAEADRSDGDRADTGRSDTGRFDSGAFEPLPDSHATSSDAATSASSRARDGWSAASVAAMNRAPETESSHNQTADLLEALRRRRGERESARFDDDSAAASKAAHPSTGSIRVVDVPLDAFDGRDSGGDVESPTTKPLAHQRDVAKHPTASRQRESDEGSAGTPSPQRPKAVQARRKGRASMPSWDEIVFGARSDDDPA